MSERVAPLVKWARLPGKLRERFRERGARDAVGWCLYQVEWRLREKRLGIETREFAHGVVVEDDGALHGYEPIDHRCLDIVLDHLEPIGPGDGFLDYGCGMGRAVVVAATRPFGRVYGVEIDPDLAAIAREQVGAAKRRGRLRAGAVEVVEADATAWPVPPEVNRVFLFNSFAGEVLDRVLDRVRDSVRAAPRELAIVYIQPVTDPDPLADVPWLERRAELPTGFWSHVRTRVYRPRGGARLAS